MQAGEFDEAQEIEETALALCRKILPDDENLLTLQTMRNLAAVYSDKHLYAKARELEEPALAGYRRLLGDTHPTTLTMTTNLAATYDALGEFRRASTMELEALETQGRIFGKEHPNTTTIAWNAIVTLRRLKDAGGVETVKRFYLNWLITADPSTLTIRQREVRGYLIDGLG